MSKYGTCGIKIDGTTIVLNDKKELTANVEKSGMHNNSMQWGKRPCIIVDNAMACAFSPCIHCVPLTTQDRKNCHYITNFNELKTIILHMNQLHYVSNIS